MKKFQLFFFTLSFLCTGFLGLKGQTFPGSIYDPNFTDNDMDAFCCQCYTIVDACSGEVLRDLTGAEVTIRCGSWFFDGRPIAQTVEVDSDGRLCIPESYRKGCEGSLTACLDFGNWEICRIDNCMRVPGTSCKIYVYQTLTTFPRINGQLIGSGVTATSGSNSVQCGRANERIALNTMQTATEIQLCPGDPAIFSMGGFSIPPRSGMCLEVNIVTESGQRVAGEVYNTHDVNGNRIDLSALFQGLSPGTLYRIEFISRCCSGEATCTRNARKTAWFRLVGLLSFQVSATAGFAPNNTPNFVPATSPPSSHLPSSGRLQFPGLPPFNLFVFNGFNVQNSSNATIDWAVKERNCLTGAVTGGSLLAGSVTPPTGSSFTLSIPVPVAMDCRCYVLELSYYDECSGGSTTQTYFFKEGDNCPPDAVWDAEDDVSFRNIQPDVTEGIRLVQNPISHELVWHVASEIMSESLQLSIFDASGRQVMNNTHVSADVLMGMPFNEKDGLYIYRIVVGEQVYSGKFVKVSR